MLPSASKYFSIKISEQYLHILTNNDRLNGLKGITKMKNGESLFQYQSRFYNVQINYYVNHRGLKLRQNNKLFPSFNAVDRKSPPYGSKGVLRNSHYRSDPKLGPGIVSLRIIPCRCHYSITQLSLTWYSKIKDACYQPIYGRLYDCK